MLSFSFDPSKGETPESVAKKRRIAEALLAQIGAPDTYGEGIQALFSGLASGITNSRANAAEKKGQEGFAERWQGVFGGMGQSSAPVSVAAEPDIASARVAQAHSGTGADLSAFLTPDKDKSHLQFRGDFNDRMSRFLADAPGGGIKIYSGYRSPERQAQLWEGALKKYGSPERARKWVAPPGKSNHGHGTAADLRYASDEVKQWAHQNAERYGLHFRMGHEPWHIEPISGWNGQDQLSGSVGTDPMGGASPVQKIAAALIRPTEAGLRANPQTTAALLSPQTSLPPQELTSMESPPEMAGAQLAQGRDGFPAAPGVQVTQGGNGQMEAPEQPVQVAQAQGQTMNDGPSMQQLMELANDPWANHGQQRIVGALLEQMMRRQEMEQRRALEQQDPAYQLDLDYKRAQIAKMQREAGQGEVPELGLNPQFGVDAQGNPVLIQIGKNGRAVQTQMPEGVSLSKEPIKLDAGTHFVLLDPITRQPVGQIPKDLAGAEEAKAMGEAQGKAAVAAPADYQSGQNALDTINQIKNHPYIDRGTGFSSTFNIRGTGGYDFENLVNQSKSGAFLTAIQQMRGMGQLSNAEGQTATAAVNRMNVATSKEEFLSALSDYEKIVKQGMAKAQGAADRAGVEIPSQGTSKRLRFNPATGELE